MYGASTINGVDMPTCDASIISGAGDIVPIDNLDHPIEIEFTLSKAQSKVPMQCAYWDESTSQFSSQGVTTSVNGRVITCATTHLTSFQIVADPNGVVTPESMDMWLIIACVLGFCAFVLCIAFIVDFCCKRKDLPYYPHSKVIG